MIGGIADVTDTIDQAITQHVRNSRDGKPPEAIYLGREDHAVLRWKCQPALISRAPKTNRVQYRGIDVFEVDAVSYIRVV